MPGVSERLPIAGWFPCENRDTLERLIVEQNIRSVAEVGTFFGLSAVWFALHEQIEMVQCVDLWFEPANYPTNNNLVGTLHRWELPKDFFSVFRENVMRTGVWHKILPIRGNSRYVHGEVSDADLVYIDADHSYEGCKLDIQNYFGKARKVICGDDYVEREGFGVIEAVTELLPGHQHSGAFWWVVKE